jgi:hypothetical protein
MRKTVVNNTPLSGNRDQSRVSVSVRVVVSF